MRGLETTAPGPVAYNLVQPEPYLDRPDSATVGLATSRSGGSDKAWWPSSQS
jgi:hypothetical protein